MTISNKRNKRTRLYQRWLNAQNLSVGGQDLTAQAVALGSLTTGQIDALGALSVAEIGSLAAIPADAVFTIGDEATNVINVAVQLNDADDAAVTGAHSVFAYLSDSATGADIAATAPSGGVANGTDGFAVPVVAGKAFQLVTDATGAIDIDIEEAGTDTFYLVVVLPSGALVVSGAITFAA